MSLLERRNRKNYYTKKDDEKIVKMYNEGHGRKEIAEALGRSVHSIDYRLRLLSKVNSLSEIKYKK